MTKYFIIIIAMCVFAESNAAGFLPWTNGEMDPANPASKRVMRFTGLEWESVIGERNAFATLPFAEHHFLLGGKGLFIKESGAKQIIDLLSKFDPEFRGVAFAAMDPAFQDLVTTRGFKVGENFALGNKKLMEGLRLLCKCDQEEYTSLISKGIISQYILGGAAWPCDVTLLSGVFYNTDAHRTRWGLSASGRSMAVAFHPEQWSEAANVLLSFPTSFRETLMIMERPGIKGYQLLLSVLSFSEVASCLERSSNDLTVLSECLKAEVRSGMQLVDEQIQRSQACAGQREDESPFFKKEELAALNCQSIRKVVQSFSSSAQKQPCVYKLLEALSKTSAADQWALLSIIDSKYLSALLKLNVEGDDREQRDAFEVKDRIKKFQSVVCAVKVRDCSGGLWLSFRRV